MSSVKEVLDQMHKTIQALYEVVTEAHGGTNSSTQHLDHMMVVLDEAMSPPVAITAEMVLELRRRTGDGMIACQKALKRSDGDMLKAVDYLRNSDSIALTDSHWRN